MDDVAALRRTLRRCTAVLLVALGLVAAYTAPYGPDNSLGYPLAYAAIAYLGASLFVGLFRRAEESTPPGGPDAGDGPNGNRGDGGDGSDGATSEADGDDEEPADEEPLDQPPVGTFGGGHW
jgi:hypothetical protein